MARRFYLSSMQTSVGHLLVTMPWKCLLMVIVSERTTAVGELLPLLMYQEITSTEIPSYLSEGK